jgi:pSer/pThr/pTyr-binding forkhead associated (FHA) protein
MWVEDLGGRNPTKLNEEPLLPGAPRLVRPGDVLLVGPFAISLLDPSVDYEAVASLGTESLALELAREMLEADPEESPYLVLLDEGAGEIDANRAQPGRGRQREASHFTLPLGEPVILGRDPGCHLPLEDSDVSRRHARLYATLEGCWLYDLKSKNGVFVDEQKIAGPWQLRTGQVIRVGNVSLKFTDPAELYLESLEKLADQIIEEPVGESGAAESGSHVAAHGGEDGRAGQDTVYGDGAGDFGGAGEDAADIVDGSLELGRDGSGGLSAEHRVGSSQESSVGVPMEEQPSPAMGPASASDGDGPAEVGASSDVEADQAQSVADRKDVLSANNKARSSKKGVVLIAVLGALAAAAAAAGIAAILLAT